MIFKSSKSDFLTRPLRDLSRTKLVSTKRMWSRISLLDPEPEFVTKPWHHQLVGFWLAVTNPHLFLLYDMGLGKSRISLDAIRYLRRIKKLKRVLILVPNVVNLESWRTEIKKHAPDLTASYVMGTKTDRLEAWSCNSAICLCTYAGLRSLVCSKQIGRRKRKRKLGVDKLLLIKARKLFNGVVLDECTAVMHHTSLTFRVVSQLTKNFVWRIGLTGTPMGRDAQVLWAQFFCVDRGASLGPTLGPFREVFFTAKDGYWGGTEYTFRKKREPDLRRMMANSSIAYSTEECLDLPKKVMVEKPFVLSDEAWGYYSAILEASRSTSEETIKGIFVRLRQIALMGSHHHYRPTRNLIYC